MTGVAQTQAQLLAGVPIGGPAGGITPQQIENIVVSMPMPNIVRAPFRPDFPPYNAKFDGSTNDTTAWSAMFTDVTSRGWGEVILPSGTSVVTGGTLNLPTNTKMWGQGPSATLIQRSGTGVLFGMSGANSGAPLNECTLRDFGLTGNGTNGVLLQVVYGNGHEIERVDFLSTNDAGIQAVQLWDSAIKSCRFLACGGNTSATAFTTSDEGGGTTIGSEALQFLSAIAASGFGSSTDSSNNVRVHDCSLINFSAGGIAIVSTTFNAVGAHQIEITGTHLESNTFSGKYFISESGASTGIRLVGNYVFLDAANNAHSSANVGSMQMIYMAANAANLIDGLDYGIGTTGLMQSVVKCWGSAGAQIKNLYDQSNNAPSNGVIWVAGGSLPGWVNIRTPNASPLVYPTMYPPLYSTPDFPRDLINVQAGNYTLAITDVDQEIDMSSGSANALTIPLNASVAFPINSVIWVRRTGAGTTTVTATGGVTLNSVTATPARWARTALVKTATDTWDFG